jgi:hypothetical protein
MDHTNSVLRCIWVILIVGQAFGQPTGCRQAIYSGFDSRLEPTLLGRLPQNRNDIVGFEIVRGTPTIAFHDRIIGLRDAQIWELPTHGEVGGMSVDKDDILRIQTPNSIEALNAKGFSRDEQLALHANGRLIDSGSGVFMEVQEKGGSVSFRLLRQDGNELPIASLKGRLRAASWNKVGLAAIVNDSLVVWEAGSPKLVRLRVDTGLRVAKSVCLVGHNRVVVALPSVVVLVTAETQTIVVGFSAMAIWRDGKLYLIDTKGGLIWALSGLGKLGGRQANAAYAKEILSGSDVSSETSPRFLEAARLIGCERAEQILAGKSHN